MRYFLALLAALLLVGTSASLQASDDHKPIAQKEQKAEQKTPVAKPQPAPIEQQKPISFDDTREKTNAHANEQLETDRQIAEYTRQLAIFTCLLVVVTAILALVAIWQGFQLKRTVDLAREEFIATHRPKLIVRQVLTEAGGPILPQDPIMQLQFSIANVGATPGRVLEVSAMLWEYPHPHFPAEPPYDASVACNIPIQSGGTFPYARAMNAGEEGDFRLDEGYGSAITTSYCLGYLIYEDDLHRRYRTAFLRRYNAESNRFLPVGDPDYEYQD